MIISHELAFNLVQVQTVCQLIDRFDDFFYGFYFSTFTKGIPSSCSFLLNFFAMDQIYVIHQIDDDLSVNGSWFEDCFCDLGNQPEISEAF